MARHLPPNAKNRRSKGRAGYSVEMPVASDGLVENGHLPGPRVESSTAVVRDAYRENYHHLYQYAYSIVGSRELAHDSVQQAFANTLATVEQGDRVENMGGFIKRCVRNVCLDQMRREQPVSLEYELPLEHETDFRLERSTAASAEIKARWHKIRSVIDQLPPNQRRAFILLELRGLGYDEIAEVMDRSTESVRQLLSRARQRVRSTAGSGSEWGGGTILLRPDHVLVQRSQTVVERSVGGIREKLLEAQTWVGNFMHQGMGSIAQPAVPIIAGVAILIGAGPGAVFPPSTNAERVAGNIPNNPVPANLDSAPRAEHDDPVPSSDPDSGRTGLDRAKSPVDTSSPADNRPTPLRPPPVDSADPAGTRPDQKTPPEPDPDAFDIETTAQMSVNAGLGTPPYGRRGGNDPPPDPVGPPIAMIQLADGSGNDSEDQDDEPAIDVGIGDPRPQTDERSRSSKFDALLKRRRDGEELERHNRSPDQESNIHRPAVP